MFIKCLRTMLKQFQNHSNVFFFILKPYKLNYKLAFECLKTLLKYLFFLEPFIYFKFKNEINLHKTSLKKGNKNEKSISTNRLSRSEVH